MSTNKSDCADASESKGVVDLDDILLKIGHYGKFQCRIFLIVFALVIFHSVLKYEFVFTASIVDYRCRVPECDGSQNSYEQSWTNFTIPISSHGRLEKCQKYKAINSTTVSDQSGCEARYFDDEFKEACGNDFIFRDKEVTISNEFKIFCADEWKLALVGTLNNFGHFIGIPLGGCLSDKYGRSKILTYGSILSSIAGLLRSFSPNYYVFLTLAFLDNFFGSAIYGVAFVLGLEFLDPSIRVHTCTLIPIVNSFGRLFLALVMKCYQNWRVLERIFYIPALGFLVLPWVLPESIRWLLSQKEEEKVSELLQKAARINNRKLSDACIEKLLQSNRQNLAASVEGESNKFPIRAALKTFPWRIINCSLCWFANVFISMGIILNLNTVGKNKYVTFMYLALIETPGFFLPSMTINRLGRKSSICGYLILSGICIATMTYIDSEFENLRLILYLLGKLTATASFQTLYIYTPEIFPTNTRNTLGSICSMIGRLGGMAAPQTQLLAKYYASASAVLFAGTAFLSGSLILFLPETKNQTLPNTLKDAENIGKSETVTTETHVQEKLLTPKA